MPSDWPNWDALRRAATSNVALLVGLGSSIYALTRVMAVARWDVTAATAILAIADLARLAAASAVPLLQFVLSAGCFLAVRWAFAVGTSSGDRARDVAATAALAIGAVLLATAVPAYYVLSASLGFLLALLLRLISRLRHTSRRPWGLQVPVLAITLVMAAATILDTRPWVAAETIAVANRTVTGYVLGSDSGWLHVLRATDGGIDILRESDVQGRAVCRITSFQPLYRSVA